MIRLKTNLRKKSSHCLTKQFVKKVQWKKSYTFSLLLQKIRKNRFKANEVSSSLELKTTFYVILKVLHLLRAKEFSSEIEGFLIQESSFLLSGVERKKNQCARTIYQKEKQFYKKVSPLLHPQFSFSNICGLQNFDSFCTYKNTRNTFLRPSKKKLLKVRLLKLFRSYNRRKAAKGSKFLIRMKTFERLEEFNLSKRLKQIRRLKKFKRLNLCPSLQSRTKTQELKNYKSRFLSKKLFNFRLSLFAQNTKKLKRYTSSSLFLRKKKSVFITLCRFYSKEYIKFLQKKKRRYKILKKRLWKRKWKKKWRWRRLGVFRLFRIRYRLRNKFSIPKHFEVNYKTGTFLYLGFLDFHSLNVRLPFRLNLRRLVSFLSS